MLRASASSAADVRRRPASPRTRSTSRSMSSSDRPVRRRDGDVAARGRCRDRAPTPRARRRRRCRTRPRSSGTPRGAGGMPVSSKCASDLLSAAISRSPCSTCTLTNGWLSIVVEKTSVARAGSDGVARDEAREHAARGLDAERQRRDVEQQHFLHLAGEHAGLDRGADRDDLVGIDPAARFLAEQLRDQRAARAACASAADEDHHVDVARGHARRRRARAGTARASPARAARRAPRARARSSMHDAGGAAAVGARRDERQVDLGLPSRSTARSSRARRLP